MLTFARRTPHRVSHALPREAAKPDKAGRQHAASCLSRTSYNHVPAPRVPRAHDKHGNGDLKTSFGSGTSKSKKVSLVCDPESLTERSHPDPPDAGLQPPPLPYCKNTEALGGIGDWSTNVNCDVTALPSRIALDIHGPQTTTGSQADVENQKENTQGRAQLGGEASCLSIISKVDMLFKT